MEFLTYEEWEEKYQPINNPRSSDGDVSFDTHNEEDIAAVAAADPRTVWTNCDFAYISSGWHYVNRMEYYITANPFINEDGETAEVWIAEDVICECLTDPEDDETAAADCKECQGQGDYRKYYTREMIDAELKEKRTNSQTLRDWIDNALVDSALSLTEMEAACELADYSDLEADIERQNKQGYIDALTDVRGWMIDKAKREETNE